MLELFTSFLEGDRIIELFAVFTGLIFLLLLIREHILCWPFGIVSSVAFAVLMYRSQLYSESILYGIYVVLGFYGWYSWRSKDDQAVPIQRVQASRVFLSVAIGLAMAFLLGYYFKNNTDAQRPYADAGSTVFSIIATFMEAHKWLVAWLFWIVINGFSIWLYYDRSLNLASILMIIYFVMSIVGYIEWKKRLSGYQNL